MTNSRRTSHGPVSGRGSAVEIHCSSDVLNNVWHLMIRPIGRGYFCPSELPPFPPPVGLSLLIVEVTRSHSVGLLWTSDQPVAECSTWQHYTHTHTQHTDIQAPDGIRTRDPSKRADAGPHRRSRGHRYRDHVNCTKKLDRFVSITVDGIQGKTSTQSNRKWTSVSM